MAEDNARQPGAADHGNELTQPIPTLPIPPQPNPTLPIPTQPAPPTSWLPPATPPPQARPDAYVGTSQSTTPLAAPGYPMPGAPGQQPGWNYGQPTQPAQPTYYSAGGFPPPPYFPPPGPYANYYSPGDYGSEPPPVKTKKRWPLLLAAAAMAIVLAATGYTLTSGLLGATPKAQVTTPAKPTPASSGSTGTQSKAVTAAEAKGVVLIEGTTSAGTAYGTGMVLTADGKVLTNYHVVAGTEKIAVTLADSGKTYVAGVVGFDQTKDVALLQLKGASGLATVTVDDDQISEGDQVAAVGNANGGMKLVKAAGKVTSTDQALTVNSDSPWGNTEDLSGLVATSAGAVPGDSGGPMFDAETEVLGMTTAGSTSDHVSYAVPISDALAVVQQIETGQDAGTVRVGPAGYLGVRVADSSYTGVGGATVSDVVAGSPAAKAGITAGSQLTKVGDTTIGEKTNVASVIRAVEPGQTVQIQWTTSAGRAKTATVMMGSSPVN